LKKTKNSGKSYNYENNCPKNTNDAPKNFGDRKLSTLEYP